MRYRVSVDFQDWEIELEAASSSDALEEASRRLDDHLENVVLEAIIIVEPIDEPQQDRGEQQD